MMMIKLPTHSELDVCRAKSVLQQQSVQCSKMTYLLKRTMLINKQQVGGSAGDVGLEGLWG